jgi:hypothetical protein
LVAECNCLAVIHREHRPTVSGRRRVGSDNQELAGHAKVDDESAPAVQAQQEVLAPSSDVDAAGTR